MKCILFSVYCWQTVNRNIKPIEQQTQAGILNLSGSFLLSVASFFSTVWKRFTCHHHFNINGHSHCADNGFLTIPWVQKNPFTYLSFPFNQGTSPAPTSFRQVMMAYANDLLSQCLCIAGNVDIDVEWGTECRSGQE